MTEIIKPFPFADLPVKPPLTGRPRISDDLQQTLASLVGWDGASRRLLRSNDKGVLQSISPNIAGIVNVLGVGVDDDYQGTDTPCSELIVLANYNNGGDIWLNLNAVGAVDTGWPLDAGDWIDFSLNNLINLHLHIVGDGDKAIILYTQ